jgi:hypothetical protein
MYYKIYNIPDNENYRNINILRFSYNKFYDTINEPDAKERSKILSFLNELKEQAISNNLCYNSIYPWNDIDSFRYNKEIIIAYNYNTNHIQGWCNITYDEYVHDSLITYTACIDKLVSRALPKIKYIGLLLLEFVRDECILKPIYYYRTDPRIYPNPEYILININLLYLYSLTTSIDFYNKTFLTQLKGNNEEDNNILKHVFIYIDQNRLHKISKKFIKQLLLMNILHTFECNSILCKKSIQKYIDFNPNENCNNNNNSIRNYNDFNQNIINYKINERRIFGSRKKRYSSTSLSSTSLSSKTKRK